MHAKCLSEIYWDLQLPLKCTKKSRWVDWQMKGWIEESCMIKQIYQNVNSGIQMDVHYTTLSTSEYLKNFIIKYKCFNKNERECKQTGLDWHLHTICPFSSQKHRTLLPQALPQNTLHLLDQCSSHQWIKRLSKTYESLTIPGFPDQVPTHLTMVCGSAHCWSIFVQLQLCTTTFTFIGPLWASFVQLPLTSLYLHCVKYIPEIKSLLVPWAQEPQVWLLLQAQHSGLARCSVSVYWLNARMSEL